MPGLSLRRKAPAVAVGLVRPGLRASGLALSVLWLVACAVKPAAAPPPVGPPPTSVMELIGIDAAALERQLGKPRLVWPEEPAQVWQYRNPTCVLNVYLYRNDGRLVVSDAEARSPKNQDEVLLPCIASLMEMHGKAVRG